MSCSFFPFAIFMLSISSADRLWIQRQLPKPRASKRTKTNARKKASNKEKKKESTPAAPSKKRKADDPGDSEMRSKRRLRTVAPETSNYQQNGRARAAKIQANVKLDLQAKQLAAAKAELMSYSRSRAPPSSHSSPRAVGTRSSRRLRGKVDSDDDDDEWQRVPDEWLDEIGRAHV